jgi:hypothetical protein
MVKGGSVDKDAALINAERGRSCKAILADPVAVTIYEETRDALAKQIIQAHPKDQIETTILKSMLVGVEGLWSRIQGLAALGDEAESELMGNLPPHAGGPTPL